MRLSLGSETGAHGDLAGYNHAFRDPRGKAGDNPAILASFTRE